MNHIERMAKGLAYVADEAAYAEMMKCRRLLQKLNFMDRTDYKGIAKLVKELFGRSDGVVLNPPFYCDYGKHIETGKDLYINYNCTILDVAKVVIGDHCLLGPNVAIYTAGHPIHPEARNSGFEYGKPVTIGDNVWIGGNSVILPGVRIGANSVIGAGSVVSRDVPAWSVAAGNPCRVIRSVTEEDRRRLFRTEEIDDEAWQVISEGSSAYDPGGAE